jgi:hypothetical protein
MSTGNKQALSFDQLQEHDDTLTDDPAKLMDLIEGVDAVTGDESKTAETDAAAKAEADAKAKPDADAKAKADADAKAKAEEDAKTKAAADAGGTKTPDGVLLKDGKSIVPYETLAAARRNEDAQRRAREAADQRVVELTRELAAHNAGGTTDKPATDARAEELQASIDALKENVPEVGEVLDRLAAELRASREQVESLTEARQHDVALKRQGDTETVQNAIDKNPTLRFLQNENEALFNEAASLDKQLRESANPAIKALTMEERFERVATVMQSIHGIVVPEKYQSKQAEKPAAAKDPKTDVKVRTEVKGREQAITLSDLPGGAPPSDPVKAAEEMSQGDIQRQVDSMLDKGKSVADIMAALSGG